MRLFAGVELDPAVRAAAADVAEQLRIDLGRAVPDLIVRWIAPANMHITVWFMGEVPAARADTLTAALASPSLHTPPFDLSLRGCGLFPPSGPPRVFWIGVAHGESGMAGLHAEVAARLAPLGFPPEHRPYAPHLTIGRVKDAGRRASGPIRELLSGVPAACGTSRVGALTLFRSRLSPRGAAYEPLLRVPLNE